MDFTIKKYKSLLHSLQNAGYEFQTFEDFLTNPKPKAIVLRHDVDLLPHHSLRFAKIQNELGIKGSYYFRAVPESWDEFVIKEIAELGHEIGYHYESLTTCKGDKEKALADFEKNLEALRKLAPVSTICMHGSPRSPYDSKDLWNKSSLGRRSLGKEDSKASPVTSHQSPVTNHDSRLTTHDSRLTNHESPVTSHQSPDTLRAPKPWRRSQSPKHYNDYGIIGEPYFDVDFSKVFYLTDTGRRWDGYKVSVRDKIPGQQVRWEREGLVFHTTRDIIDFLQNGRSLKRKRSLSLPKCHQYVKSSAATEPVEISVAERVEVPDQIMFTFHPQRWNAFGFAWVKELVLQNLKNVVKRFLVS